MERDASFTAAMASPLPPHPAATADGDLVTPLVLDAAVLGSTDDRVEVRLDRNESPLGPPTQAIRRVVEAARLLHRYPAGVFGEVTARMADHLGVPQRHVLLTAGVDEAVDLMVSLARRAWVVRPGFDGYVDRVLVSGRRLDTIRLDANWLPTRTLLDGEGDGAVVFVAQPNNPTGNSFDPCWLEELRRRADYVFLDETYQEFSSRRSLVADGAGDARLVVYRSFSKAMGLAGIRLGCLVASAATVAALRARQRFQPVDMVSLQAAAGTLDDTGYVERLVAYVREARSSLVALLADSGAFSQVRETETNFVLAELRAGIAHRVLAALDDGGVRVRRCEGLGLPGWIRVSVGTPDDHLRLWTSLRRGVEEP